jgi:predicted nuclease of predicted toxin-antitoxin system
MKFKIDENIPSEFATLLNNVNYDTKTIIEQNLAGHPDENIAEVCKKEKRILITLDTDFADIRNYPPKDYSGIIVFRVYRQDKYTLINLLQKIVPILKKEELEKHLWIVEEKNIRIRG